MGKVLVKIKKVNPNAKLPTYAHDTDACCDLYFCPDDEQPVVLRPSTPTSLDTGVVIETPVGYELQVRGRSGLSLKGIAAAFGTIDAGYVGTCRVTLTNNTQFDYVINPGDRIGQVAIKEVLQMDFQEVDEIVSTTARGAKGFGSSGR